MDPEEEQARRWGPRPVTDEEFHAVRPKKKEERSAETSWLAQMARDAGRYEQPELCLPVVDGMALDQLLVKLRMAADNEFAFLVKDKTEQSLRKLDDAPLWEVTQHMYANLDSLISMFRWRWREENHPLLERARAWHYRRSGWFILLAETKDASILVSPDWRHMFEARARGRPISPRAAPRG
jgi:hypothetical protein